MRKGSFVIPYNSSGNNIGTLLWVVCFPYPCVTKYSAEFADLLISDKATL